MSGGNDVTRNLLAQEPGRDNRHAIAAGTQYLPNNKPQRHNAGTPYFITSSTGGPIRIIVAGRLRWALQELRKAGPTGCTPIHNPGPRWAAYVHRLRELGVEIETITEPHEGDFPGHHARYVLRSGVSLEQNGGAA